LAGGSFSKDEKSKFEPKLLSSFREVAKNKGITDIRGGVSALESTSGFGKVFSRQFEELKRQLDRGDERVIPGALNQFRESTLNTFKYTGLDDKDNTNYNSLIKGLDSLDAMRKFISPEEISKTAKVKTDELLGVSPVAPKGFPGTSSNDFSSAQTILLDATNTFATSTQKLADIISSEIQRNSIISDQASLSEEENTKTSQVKNLEEKLNKIRFLQEQNKSLETDYVTGKNRGFLDTQIENAAVLGTGLGYPNKQARVDAIQQKRLSEFQTAQKFTRGTAAEDVEKQAPGFLEVQRQLQSEISGFGSSLSEALQNISAQLEEAKSPIQKPQSNKLNIPSQTNSNLPVSSPTTSQVSPVTAGEQPKVEVVSSRNVNLSINGVVTSVSSDTELEDRMLNRFVAWYNANSKLMGGKAAILSDRKGQV
jgi:hypothetical protein